MLQSKKPKRPLKISGLSAGADGTRGFALGPEMVREGENRMENNRPRRREKQVEGPGKTVGKRGEGLGTGPVGDAGGYQDRKRKTDTDRKSVV